MNWSIRYANDARAKRIMKQLREKYPKAKVIDDAGSYFALTEPTKDHPDYDSAVQVVVGPTPPHSHEHTSHEYSARDTAFNLHMDGKVVRVGPGKSHHVPPKVVHYISVDPGVECWLDVTDHPGLDDNKPDVIKVKKMNWNERYANDMGTPDGDTGAPDDGLSTMATDLNSHIFSYTGQSGQSPTDRMYKGNKGADLDNQTQLSNLRSKYNDSSTGAIGKAVQQIKLFTGKDSYGSDIRTNREKFPEFHSLMDQASPIAGGLSRGTVLTDVRHGTPGSPIDISQHYKVGDKMTTQVTSATSDPELAKSWVLDDKQRFDKAKDTGDNSVLDTKYNGARHAAFVVQHFPAGIKGLQVAPLSAVPEHNEVVPQAGQKLIVSNITGPDESGVHHVYYKHDTERTASWSQRYAYSKTR